MDDRDTFAAAALTGFVADGIRDADDYDRQLICSDAYRWADAMLRERNGAVESRETVHLADAEREAIAQVLDEMSGKASAESWVLAILRNLLGRMK